MLPDNASSILCAAACVGQLVMVVSKVALDCVQIHAVQDFVARNLSFFQLLNIERFKKRYGQTLTRDIFQAIMPQNSDC